MSDLATLDLVLRAGTVTLALATASALALQPRRNNAAVWAALVVGGTGAFMIASAPRVHATLGPAAYFFNAWCFATPAAVWMLACALFRVETLEHGQTPAQAIAAHPEWKTYWYDEPEHQHGRRTRYYQQLQRLDVEGAWRNVAVPPLIVWDEYDWIMGREESDRAASILRARDPSLVRYVVRPGMNHHFYVFKDPGAAFAEKGGTFDAGAANEIAAWIRTQMC